jgi:AraC family transcriptional regulator
MFDPDTVLIAKQSEACPGHPLHQHMQEAVCRAVALLEAADRQLGQTQEAARSAIARAASILLAEVGHSGEASPTGKCGGLLPWQARRVTDYIEEHLGTPIRVADLSALVHRTESHFSRVFKLTFGVSPHAYVLHRRIERAARLMIESTEILADIALKCGFNDQAHFSKRFRQHMGATPAAWRRERMLL